MKRLYIILLLISVFYSNILAEVSFTAIPPRNVIAGNKFNVTFRLKNGDGEGLKVSQIDGCTLLYGPSTSTMQSYQMINGNATSSTTVDYSYIYRAEKEGTYTIEPASINVDGKMYSTQPVKFTVLPADKLSSTNSNQSVVRVDDYNTQTRDKQVSGNDVFVRIILSRSRAYEQEAIECTIKLYTKYQISTFMPTTQPNFDGFLIEEVNLQPELNQMENYKGQNYMTAVLKKCIIFPQKSGKLTINSGKYDISVVQYERINMGFFGSTRPVEKEIKVSSNSASIIIDPLPQPQPEGFTGAVGKFSIDSKLVGSSFRTNEAASLVYTIKGTGNIKYIKEPIIDFPTEFEQYTPKADIKASLSGANMSGTMSIEYTFIPQSVGKFTIGGDKFVYFDPSSRQYVTLTTPPYTLDVAKGINSPSVSSDVAKQDIKAKNTDILHIKLGDKNQQKQHNYIVYSVWYWPAYIVLTLILGLIIYLYGKQAKASADVQGRKLARANKVAQKRLKMAKSFMDSRENDKFYEELLRVIWGYVSDKLSIPASQLSRENILNELIAYGADKNLTDILIEVLDECEMARYSPAQSNEQIEGLYAKATNAINIMENVKRTKR